MKPLVFLFVVVTAFGTPSPAPAQCSVAAAGLCTDVFPRTLLFSSLLRGYCGALGTFLCDIGF